MNPTHQSKLPIRSSAVTDRGLNKKRPLNEDSFLADSERGIFAVADGVGGAEAGEVASQTAIEVLDEAFRHQTAGADVEDLMELAIQRANASIHQMAQDSAKFSMMATTIVGLHIDGNIATIGHVGDSRLYRLTPEGQLVRETEDHSVVEEEVRAGRMTAEQAANHPSKNVISRAIGAETGVDVDMKVIEIDDGTEFLLCTDGITRHIPDYEIRQLLLVHDDLSTLCSELKDRCYERGAEDNLTAVVVRVGTKISTDERAEDLEKTISPEISPLAVAPTIETPGLAKEPPVLVAPTLQPASRTAFPSSPPEDHSTNVIQERLEVAPPVKSKSGIERTMTRFLVFVLVLGALAGTFYAGRKYKGPVPFLDPGEPLAEASPAPSVALGRPPVLQDETLLRFDGARQEVDRDPNGWLTNRLPAELLRQGLQAPLASSEPEFLYFYGRASLLAGNADAAAQAFESSIAKAHLNPTDANATLIREATFGLAAVALKLEAARPAAQKRLEEAIRRPTPPSSSPPASPLVSP
ncbi:MAG TPA: PP2C family serine/threonine-protein phosphatase [Pyrinomonadaceae bacterium]|nr:PP2C family serine/threonine-protein phosphatase [Pyrinomonadaceae bacterium]